MKVLTLALALVAIIIIITTAAAAEIVPLDVARDISSSSTVAFDGFPVIADTLRVGPDSSWTAFDREVETHA